MADELETVTQRFEADMAEYAAEIEEGVAAAQEFAAANEEAKAATDGLRDGATEAGVALGSIRDGAAEASAADDSLRDSAAETATALGHLRDEAIEAAAAMHELRDSEVEAGAAGAAAEAGGMSMMAVGITALIGLAAALLPAVLAVGVALGGFALFAIPTITQITGALGDTKAQLDKLPAPIRDAVEAVKSLESAWKTMAKAFQPEVLTAVNEALSIASDLMQKIAPIAMQGAFAVNGILEALKGGVDSGGFSKFLSTLSALVLPVTHALTQLAGTILGILGHAIEQLAPLAVPMINMLNDLLKAAGPGLSNGLQFIAQAVLDLGRAITPMLGPLGSLFGYLDDHPVFAQIAAGILGIVAAVKIWTIAQGLLNIVLDANPIVLIGIAIALLALLIITHTHQISEAFDAVRHAIATAGHDIASVFDSIRHTVATWGHDVASTFDTVRHSVASIGDAIVHPFEAAFDWLKANWKLVVAILVDPIGTAVMEIKDHTKQISQAFDQLRHDVAAIFDGIRHDVAAILDGARHDISTAWDNVRHDTAAIVDAIPGDVEKAWDTVKSGAVAAFNDVLKSIEDAWKSITSSTSTGVSQVGNFFKALPGQVASFLAALPGQMLTIGKNVIDGLINGIKQAAEDIPGIMKGLASDVASYFTDPLKILSPSLVFFEHGQNIVRGAINGVRAMAPQLLATMRGLGTSVATGGIGAASAVAPAIGGAGATVHVNVNAQGTVGVNYADPRYQQALQQAVQEVTLRHAQVNPTNGLTPMWGR